MDPQTFQAPTFHINPAEAIELKTENPKTAVWYIGDHMYSTVPHPLKLCEMLTEVPALGQFPHVNCGPHKGREGVTVPVPVKNTS